MTALNLSGPVVSIVNRGEMWEVVVATDALAQLEFHTYGEPPRAGQEVTVSIGWSDDVNTEHGSQTP